MKETIIKSVTAVLCVVAVCVSSVLAVGKYGDAMIETAKNTPAAAASTSAGGSSASTDTGTGDATVDPSATPDAGAADAGTTDPTADSGSTATDSGSASTGGSASSGSTSSGTGSASSAKDPTSYSKAEIVNYYNTSLKNSYKQKVSVSRSEKIDIVVDRTKPDSSAIVSLANKIVQNYAKENVVSKSFTGGKASDGTLIANFCPKTGLTADGAKSATVKKSGSNYVITINVVSEKATLNSAPKYNKLCAAPLDLNTVDLFGLKITKADFNYPATVLTATVDANGRVLNSSVYQPLNGTGGGKFIAISLEGTAHGSWTQKCTYKY